MLRWCKFDKASTETPLLWAGLVTGTATPSYTHAVLYGNGVLMTLVASLRVVHVVVHMITRPAIRQGTTLADKGAQYDDPNTDTYEFEGQTEPIAWASAGDG